MSENNEPQNIPQNPADVEKFRGLSRHYVVKLKEFVGEFVKNYPKYNFQKGDLLSLIHDINVLESRFNDNLKELKFDHNMDMKTYQAWCLLDNVRAYLEKSVTISKHDQDRISFVDRNPKAVIDSIVSMINNFNLE